MADRGDLVLSSIESERRGTYKLSMKIENAPSSSDGIASDYSQKQFEPYVLRVRAGEDIYEKLTTFFKDGEGLLICATGEVAQACILLNQRRLVEYEGQFELVSLTGTFLKTTAGTIPSISIKLAKANHRLFGGHLAGKLIAASNIQMVVGRYR